jgi:hypothetical protein
MLKPVSSEQNRHFEDRGRQWARDILDRPQPHWREIPLVWPGTREQAETIVHAPVAEPIEERHREHFVDVVQNAARAAWRDLTNGATLSRISDQSSTVTTAVSPPRIR